MGLATEARPYLVVLEKLFQGDAEERRLRKGIQQCAATLGVPRLMSHDLSPRPNLERTPALSREPGPETYGPCLLELITIKGHNFHLHTATHMLLSSCRTHLCGMRRQRCRSSP